MKKHYPLWQWTFIVLTFLTLHLLMIGCRQSTSIKKENVDTATVLKPAPPQIDIHTAIITGNAAALQQHIAAGTNLDEKDPLGGSSPLITACLFGKTEEARLLIDAGADLNFKNNDGSTPLHTAAFFCRPAIVTMLLAKNADRTIKNKYGQTPYEIVAGSFDTVEKIYNDLGKMLEPMGLKLDYTYLKQTRPGIAEMLK